MDTRSLDLFVAVARAGSFAAVARDQGLDPSAVSRAIAALEASLGTRLFQRTTRSMRLSEAGELYLARLPTVLEDLARLRDEAASLRFDPVGVLRVTASVAFGQVRLMPLMPDFRSTFPRLKLELLLTDGNLDLIADRIDLAFRLGPEHRADVVGEPLFATRYRVVAAPEWLAAQGRPARIQDLTHQACLLLSLPAFRSRWLFRTDEQAEPVSVPIFGDLVLSSPLALRTAAMQGLGPALLADWLVDDAVAQGELVDLFPDHRVTATTFDTAAWLLHPGRDYLPRKTRSAIAFFKQRLGKAG